MKQALEDIVELLETNNIETSFTDIADLLWLYSAMDGESKSSKKTINNKENKKEERGSEGDKNQKKEPKFDKDNKRKLYKESKKEGSSKGDYFKTPTQKQFNKFNQFATVLKILKQFSSSSSDYEFDEQETIEYIANTNVWNIVTTPQKELKYTLFIIIETSISMRIWQEITQEFVSALSRFSFFKDIKVVYLKEQDREYQLYRDKQCKKRVSSKLFNSQTQRTLTILLSDCISKGWQDKRGYRFLDEITALTPFLIINMLPQRVWNRTMINDSWRVKFIHREGWKNSTLVSDVDEEEDIDDILGEHIRIPMTTLEKIPLKHWSNLIAGYKDNWLYGSLFEAEIFNIEIPQVSNKQSLLDNISPEQQVKNFYRYASPLAHELAIYFSAVDNLSIEIMKMIQRTSLPKTNHTHLAEVFLSGLLKRGELKTKSNDDTYQFKNGVREVLSKRLPAELKEKIRENNSEFIKKHLGHLQEFQTVVENDKGSVDGTFVNNNEFANVEDIDVEKEPNSLTLEELKEIIAQDENEKLEFKARWNQSMQELIKYIFSLVNGNPEHIDETAYFIIGVDERSKNNFKLTKKLANFDKFKKELFENLNDYAQPKLKDILIEWYNLAKNNGVIVISIPPQGHLVSLYKDLKIRKGIAKKGTVYYRVGDRTNIASVDIILDFKKAYSKLNLDISWLVHLEYEFSKSYMKELKKFLAIEKKHDKNILPKGSLWFNALNSTPLDKVKVVILGQDPYPTVGHAHGLAFSVLDDVRPLPKSLQNIYKELFDDLGINNNPMGGNLQKWAEQGVLLLNSVLTVEEGKSNSHQGRGWEQFTDKIIEVINNERKNVVFILWGAYAQKKGTFIDKSRHLVIKSPHPAPLSAYRGFFGSKPFSQTNTYLQSFGKEKIDWNLKNIPYPNTMFLRNNPIDILIKSLTEKNSFMVKLKTSLGIYVIDRKNEIHIKSTIKYINTLNLKQLKILLVKLYQLNEYDKINTKEVLRIKYNPKQLLVNKLIDLNNLVKKISIAINDQSIIYETTLYIKNNDSLINYIKKLDILQLKKLLFILNSD